MVKSSRTLNTGGRTKWPPSTWKVWRPGSPPRPVKRELSQEAPPDAAAVKLEPVGLKLEQVEEKETAVDDMEMAEVLCEEEPLHPARAQPLPDVSCETQ